jgi:hypothetical protein
MIAPSFGEAYRVAFDMAGNLVAEVAARRRAEPGGLCAATRRSGGRPTPGSELRAFDLRMFMREPA